MAGINQRSSDSKSFFTGKNANKIVNVYNARPAELIDVKPGQSREEQIANIAKLQAIKESAGNGNKYNEAEVNEKMKSLDAYLEEKAKFDRGMTGVPSSDYNKALGYFNEKFDKSVVETYDNARDELANYQIASIKDKSAAKQLHPEAAYASGDMTVSVYNKAIGKTFVKDAAAEHVNEHTEHTKPNQLNPQNKPTATVLPNKPDLINPQDKHTATVLPNKPDLINPQNKPTATVLPNKPDLSSMTENLDPKPLEPEMGSMTENFDPKPSGLMDSVIVKLDPKLLEPELDSMTENLDPKPLEPTLDSITENFDPEFANKLREQVAKHESETMNIDHMDEIVEQLKQIAKENPEVDPETISEPIYIEYEDGIFGQAPKDFNHTLPDDHMDEIVEQITKEDPNIIPSKDSGKVGPGTILDALYDEKSHILPNIPKIVNIDEIVTPEANAQSGKPSKTFDGVNNSVATGINAVENVVTTQSEPTVAASEAVADEAIKMTEHDSISKDNSTKTMPSKDAAKTKAKQAAREAAAAAIAPAESKGAAMQFEN